MSLKEKLDQWAGPLTTALGITGNYFSARRRERHDIKMSHMAHQQNIDFWKRQNEYNLPSMQMQRLKDAGLNPHLVYGTGTVDNTAGGIAGFVPPRSSEANFNPLETLSQHLGNEKDKVQLKLGLQQIRVDEAREILTKAQAEGILSDNITKELESLISQQIMKPTRFDIVSGEFIETNESHISALAHAQVNRLVGMGIKEQMDAAIRQWEKGLTDANINPRDTLLLRMLADMLQEFGITPSRVMRNFMNQSQRR